MAAIEAADRDTDLYPEDNKERTYISLFEDSTSLTVHELELWLVCGSYRRTQ